MKRAVRCIPPPTMRRHRLRRLDLGLVHITNNHQYGNRAFRNDRNCLRQRWKSTASHSDADSFDREGRRPQHVNEQPPTLGIQKPQHREKRKHRKSQSQNEGQQQQQRGSRMAYAGDRGRLFANIQEAQDTMQDLLDRLVEIGQSDRIPVTVRNLAMRNNDPGFVEETEASVNGGSGAFPKRVAVFWEAGDVFDGLIRSVDEGILSPSGKHGRELSQLAECLLYVIGQQQPQQPPWHSISGESIENFEEPLLEADEIVHALSEVLRVLEVDWNLDVEHRHYDKAIAAACSWGEWGVASDLFEKQIDPNAGRSPVKVSIDNPLGLFAMTQRYNNRDSSEAAAPPHEEESMIAEQIMDAVQRLVMVSPRDQSTYVLAAGNALGHAGAWRELNDYRRTSFLSKQYGTPLVAACLRACVLCGEYEAGLALLIEEGFLSASTRKLREESLKLRKHQQQQRLERDDPFSASIGGDDNDNANDKLLEEEWQWGGARDRMDPLIRDLAMQILGGTSALRDSLIDDRNEVMSVDEYDSRLALDLFWQSREEGVTISKEALLGVAEACEGDKDWRGAFSVLRTVLDEEELRSSGTDVIAPWIVSGDELSIVERDQVKVQDDDESNTETVLTDLGPFLASIMRNCNSASNFGLSLFALRLFQTQLLGQTGAINDTDQTVSPSSTSLLSSPEEAIVRMLSAMKASRSPGPCDEIVIPSMVALSGLRCHQNAIRLYELTAGDVGGDGTTDQDGSSALLLLYEYASLNQKRHGTLVLGNPWLSAHGHIEKLTGAILLAKRILRGTTASPSPGDHNRNRRRALTDRQREGIEEILARTMNSCTGAHQPLLSLYLLEWMEDALVSSRANDSREGFRHNTTSTTSFFDRGTVGVYGDSVTAELILALRWTGDLRGAIELFEGLLEHHASSDDAQLVRWRRTITEGLSAMVACGRGEDAQKVFGVLPVDARSTESYATIGKHLSRGKDWKGLIDLYRDAHSHGFSSEELGLLAMLAVTSTKVDHRLRILRAIVDDCSGTAGVDAKKWTTAKYWQLKKILGFYHARLLMWWNDEERAPLDEVNLAIKEFRRETSDGMRPKNDVVRAILEGAIGHSSLGLEGTGGYEQVPRSPEQWAEVIREVLEALSSSSSLKYDPNFVDSVVKAYLSLRRPGDCLDYIRDVLEVDGTRIRKSTISDLLRASESEGASDIYRDMAMMLSRSGEGAGLQGHQ